jgi:hypothetical protein
MRQRPSIVAAVLSVLVIGAGVGSVAALDAGATGAPDAQTTDRTLDARGDPGDDVRPAHQLRVGSGDSGFYDRIAGVDGPNWVDDLDGLLGTFDLNETERESILDEADAMRAANATDADVAHMVHYRLYGHGYDATDVHAHAVAHRLDEEFDLTDEQVDELAGGIAARIGDDADYAEIREYVRETLEEFGVEDEEIRAAAVEHRLRMVAEHYELSDDQTERLVDGAVDLVEAGAGPAELRDYVRETLEEFGVDLPDRGERRGAERRR